MSSLGMADGEQLEPGALGFMAGQPFSRNLKATPNHTKLAFREKFL